jgi:non-specific protein-tyrosine kinase
VDLRHLIAFVRAWFLLIGVSVLLAGLAGFAVSMVLPKVYEAKTTMLVGQALSSVNPDFGELQVSQLLAPTYAAMAETRPILDNVIGKLGLSETPDTLATRIHVDTPLGTSILTVTAQDGDPNRAAAIANAVASALIAVTPSESERNVALQRSISAQLDAVQAQIATAEDRLAELALLPTRTAKQDAEVADLDSRLVTLRSTFATLLSSSTSSPANQLTVIESATPATSSVSPRLLLNTALAAALGLLVAIGIGFGIDSYRGPSAPMLARRERAQEKAA